MLHKGWFEKLTGEEPAVYREPDLGIHTQMLPEQLLFGQLSIVREGPGKLP